VGSKVNELFVVRKYAKKRVKSEKGWYVEKE
jgi:hypothetical protein